MTDDGNLHLWECTQILRLPSGNPDFKRCGFIVRAVPGDEPGWCPYDHGERVRLVPLSAVALCSACAIPVPADDCRADDGRLICGGCVEVGP
jgi:hypothetical protein